MQGPVGPLGPWWHTAPVPSDGDVTRWAELNRVVMVRFPGGHGWVDLGAVGRGEHSERKVLQVTDSKLVEETGFAGSHVVSRWRSCLTQELGRWQVQ